MKHNNILLDTLTEVLKTQEGFKEKKASDVKASVRGLLNMHQQMMQLGRKAFLKHGEDSLTANIFERVDHRIDHVPVEFKANKDHVILIDERDYFILYRTLLNVFEGENYSDAINMAMVLAILEPLRIQPYIILGTILMRESGAHSAAEFYEKIMPNFKDPLLYFYAADAYAHANLKSEARHILQEAITLTKHLKSNQAKELKRGLEAYLKSL